MKNARKSLGTILVLVAGIGLAVAGAKEDVSLQRDGGFRPPWKVLVWNHGNVPIRATVQKMCGKWNGLGYENAVTTYLKVDVEPGEEVYVGTEMNESCQFTITGAYYK